MQGIETSGGQQTGSIHAGSYELRSPRATRESHFREESLAPRTRASYAVSLIVAAVFLASLACSKAEDYWGSVLDRARLLYGVRNGHATGPAYENLKEGDRLRAEVVERLKNDPSLVQQVRKSLRNDDRVWVRSFSASMLLKAFAQQDADDAIYMMSDPDLDVRGFGLLGIRVYRMEKAAGVLPAGLLSKHAVERCSAVRGIRKMMGAIGLPYYAKSLYDSDLEVASEAAKAFRCCKREDAVPHFLRYLRECGKSHRKRSVTRSVVDSLRELYGEPVTENGELKKEVDDWVKRLTKEVSKQGPLNQ